MPITVECPCGKRLKAGDEAAGRRARCPACGNSVTFPTSEPEADKSPVPNVTLDDDPFGNPGWKRPEPETPPPSAVPLPLPTPSSTKACPYCGEEVLAVAKKCKHCGEFLDANLKQAREAPKWNPGIAAILSLVLPGVGQMYKGQVATGIIQAIGSLFAYATNIYVGLFLHLGSVLHAAIANPHRKVATGPSPIAKMNPVVFWMLVIIGLGAVAFVTLDLLSNRR